MADELFKRGGPHKIKRAGPNQYEMIVSLPKDDKGCIARECPTEGCSPGYFKVKLGTGITEGQEYAYCPYCRFKTEPKSFTTKEQIRYAKDLVVSEAQEGIGQMIKETLDLGPTGKKKIGGDFISMEISYKPGEKPQVRRPIEEEVRRDVVCPHCGLDHSVYGLAIWCADCGQDIFITHVEAEMAGVRQMLGDVDRRREILGVRIAAKDLENCLEDTVSIFEAVLRAFARRYLSEHGSTREEVEQFIKKIGNSFQNIARAEEIFHNDFQVSLLQEFVSKEIDILKNTFEKRHLITHNLGVVDKKYIERARAAEEEGREILVTKEEIEEALVTSLGIFKTVHERLFSQDTKKPIDASTQES